MTNDPKAELIREQQREANRTAAEPVAQPMPKMDGSKPIPAGSDEVEKFNVATDTAGGD